MRLEATVSAILDRRLAPGARRPICVALSGGGDSLALLILALNWARRHDRSVEALVFDHGLHPDSPAWSRFGAEAALRLGAGARILQWAGPQPETGLPAAARAARHAALADAARKAGAHILLMGHTADDRLEAEAMRADGTNVSDPQSWAPSPAWPEGRGVFILRPLLDIRRKALRDFLSGLGETWLDDPANVNARFARARARASLSGEASTGLAPEPPAAPVEGWREIFGALQTDGMVSPRALAAACLCAGGTAHPPDGAALKRLAALAASGHAFTATLAGARVQRRAGTLTVTREAGRVPSPVLLLDKDDVTVWDGRFEVRAARSGLAVRALGGLASRLPKPQRDALAAAPTPARPTLPVLTDASGAVACPLLADKQAGGTAVSLIMDRFKAACGEVQTESA